MPRTPEETRALFDRWAGTYDTDLSGSTGTGGDPLAGYAESLREAASLVAISNELVVLDIGIGTGAFAAIFAEGGAKIMGVDPSENMLSLCRQRHPGYFLEHGSFTDIPLADGRVDAAVSSFAFHEVPAPERETACREIVRVLKPGGTICLLDIMFASSTSRNAARVGIGPLWDEEEDYPLIGDLDALLRSVGFTNTFWRQTAPCHWAVVARRVGGKPHESLADGSPPGASIRRGASGVPR